MMDGVSILLIVLFCIVFLYFIFSTLSQYAQENKQREQEAIQAKYPNKEFVEAFIKEHPVNFYPENERELLAIDSLKNAYACWMGNDYSSARKNFLESATLLSNDEIAQYKADCIIKIIADFSDYDPIYHFILDETRIILKSKSGILQTEIYSFLRDYSKKDIQYVLYYADFKKEIKREKKGRSYILALQVGNDAK
ncbi:hypothetical protein BBW65_07125 [Helicobacter enhydrae]|uniref:Uncharacterized protein n=1 Tax=Helicobacter enhydrae TaxID=222136 RepID=A0A1B1U764_9HELI|nr:hypothetical protein [Helicobacter enhydrae]ANV98580.1 hypothetical protein BBW65_07125 [Helicobacter enhydrae]